MRDDEAGPQWIPTRYEPPCPPRPRRPIDEVARERGRELTAQERLELLDEAEVMDAIRSGVLIRNIAKAIGVSLSALQAWLKAPLRTASYIQARTDAAQAYDELAETAILSAPASPMELARARELASHYRWRAKVLNPNTYGDKVQATVTHDVVAELRDRIHAADSRLPVKSSAEKVGDLMQNEIERRAKSLIPNDSDEAALADPHSIGPDSGPVRP